MSKIVKRLQELGYTLAEAPKPVASYIPALQTGNLVFTSGQLPMKDGEIVYSGEIGGIYSDIESGQKAAKLCILNALSAIQAVIGDLDRITRIVRINGFVKSAVLFNNQPGVINGASDFILEIFGPEIGNHTRTAIGVKELPLNASVEIDMIVQID
jgi:enamine deaminase RidA (YjgF/YER057c/UK114 family)